VSLETAVNELFRMQNLAIDLTKQLDTYRSVVRELVDVVRQYKSATELKQLVELDWNCYKEGNEALKRAEKLLEGK